jgi:hypothetical protein
MKFTICYALFCYSIRFYGEVYACTQAATPAGWSPVMAVVVRAATRER